MAIIKGLLKRIAKYPDGIYPYTQTDCVFDESGNALDGLLDNINRNKQDKVSAGRGISISGNTINNQFENLISDATIANGDKLIIKDSSNSGAIASSSIMFGGNANQYLANNGTWQTPTVDSELSSTSTNPLQNKAINTALNNKANSSHAHGNITSGGDITSNVAIASGDRLVINDESASKLANSTITFGSDANEYLANNGTWQSTRSLTTLYGKNWIQNEIFDLSSTINISYRNYSLLLFLFISNYLSGVVVPYAIPAIELSSDTIYRYYQITIDSIT